MVSTAITRSQRSQDGKALVTSEHPIPVARSAPFDMMRLSVASALDPKHHARLATSAGHCASPPAKCLNPIDSGEDGGDNAAQQLAPARMDNARAPAVDLSADGRIDCPFNDNSAANCFPSSAPPEQRPAEARNQPCVHEGKAIQNALDASGCMHVRHESSELSVDVPTIEMSSLSRNRSNEGSPPVPLIPENLPFVGNSAAVPVPDHHSPLSAFQSRIPLPAPSADKSTSFRRHSPENCNESSHRASEVQQPDHYNTDRRPQLAGTASNRESRDANAVCRAVQRATIPVPQMPGTSPVRAGGAWLQGPSLANSTSATIEPVPSRNYPTASDNTSSALHPAWLGAPGEVPPKPLAPEATLMALSPGIHDVRDRMSAISRKDGHDMNPSVTAHAAVMEQGHFVPGGTARKLGVEGVQDGRELSSSARDSGAYVHVSEEVRAEARKAAQGQAGV
jgi:hypothetical protein